MRFRHGLVALLVPVLFFRPGPVSGQQSAASTPAQLLKPGDQLLIQVKNEPNLSGRYAIGPGGVVMLPVLGMVTVVDRPFAEIEATIRAGLARELPDPEILITPLMRVSVLGEVRVPGFQWLDATGTLADLMVMSGGLLPTAKRKQITLMRDGVEQRIALEPGGAAPRLALRSGDQLLVARRSWLSENLPIFIGAAASVAAAAATSLIVR
jgi:polysaccharide export outer membrane protein